MNDNLVFEKAYKKYGFKKVDYSKFPDGIYCTGCNAVHDQPTKVYVNDNDGVFCKPQIIKLYKKRENILMDNHLIEYYSSTISPNYFFVAVDGVIVADFLDSRQIDDRWTKPRWIDKGIYRPVRGYCVKINWNKIPYNPKDMASPEEFEIVKSQKREATAQQIEHFMNERERKKHG